MDIVAYLRVLRRHWKMIAATTVVGALLGFATTLLPSSEEAAQRTFYKATHTLFLDTSSVSSQFRPVYTNLDQIAVLVTTGDVPRQVATTLGGDANEWTSQIFTVTNGTTSTLDITCAERNDDDAVTCADTFAAALIADLRTREESRFNTQRDDTIQRLDALEGQIAQLDGQIATRPGDGDVLQAQRRSLVNAYSLAYENFQQLAAQGGPATVLSTLESGEAEPITESEYDNRIAQGQLGLNRVRADVVSNPDVMSGPTESSERYSGPVSRATLGGLLGLLVGVGLAVVADRADRRLRTREDVEVAFGMPVLAEVPALSSAQQKLRTVESVTSPLSRTAEAYRAVRSSLMFQRVTDPRQRSSDEALVILVGSAGPKEGKTTTAANLAAVFAETGARVLAVNCDFRRPTLHHYFGLSNEPRRVFETEIPGLWVITDVISDPSGANPALAVEEQRRLVTSARSRFDVIILDTAPLLTTNDATELLGNADLVVLTCRIGTSTTDGAQRVLELLSRIAAPVAGVVVLGSESASNDYYYYYAHEASKDPVDPLPSTGGDGGDGADGLFGPEPTLRSAFGARATDGTDDP